MVVYTHDGMTVFIQAVIHARCMNLTLYPRSANARLCMDPSYVVYSNFKIHVTEFSINTGLKYGSSKGSV